MTYRWDRGHSHRRINSIDDALLQQINALTPSFAGVARNTVTKDETLTLLPQPSAYAAEEETSEPSSIPADEHLNVKRDKASTVPWLIGGTVLAVLIAVLMYDAGTSKISPPRASVEKQMQTGLPKPSKTLPGQRQSAGQITLTEGPAPQQFDSPWMQPPMISKRHFLLDERILSAPTLKAISKSVSGVY